jgi:hypothetical protein
MFLEKLLDEFASPSRGVYASLLMGKIIKV